MDAVTRLISSFHVVKPYWRMWPMHGEGVTVRIVLLYNYYPDVLNASIVLKNRLYELHYSLIKTTNRYTKVL